MTNMETKYTKGDWVNNIPVIDTLRTTPISCGGKIVACINAYEFYGCSIEESNANAKLIAAAPQLLEALQGICNILEITSLSNKPTFKDDFIIAQEAINKAIGHEQNSD